MLVIALAMIRSFSRTPSFSPVSGLNPGALVMNGSVAVPVVLMTLGSALRSISVPLTVIETIWLTASIDSASSVASDPPTAGSPTRNRLAVGAGRNSLRRTGSMPPWSTPSISGSAMSRSAERRMRTPVRLLAPPSEVIVSRLVRPATGVTVVTATLASGETESSAVLIRSWKRSRMLARLAALISAVVHGPMSTGTKAVPSTLISKRDRGVPAAGLTSPSRMVRAPATAPSGRRDWEKPLKLLAATVRSSAPPAAVLTWSASETRAELSLTKAGAKRAAAGSMLSPLKLSDCTASPPSSRITRRLKVSSGLAVR